MVVFGVVAFIATRIVAGAKAVPAITAPAIFVVLFFLVHLPFIAEPRYMTPVLPVSVAVAIATWVQVVQRFRQGHLTRK
jgi:hypothetical protein